MDNDNISVNAHQVQDYLRKLQSRLVNTSPLMHGIGQELANITEDAFEARQTPDGKSWAPLSSVTLHLRGLRAGKGKGGKGGKAYAAGASNNRQLYDTGALMRTVRHESTDDSTKLSLGPHPSGVAILMFGGMAGRGRKVKIPGRQAMPVQGEQGNMDLMPVASNRILQMMQDYVEGVA